MVPTAETGLVLLGYCDLGAVVRGRLIPAIELAEQPRTTVGWTPSALAKPPFGPSARPNPFGPIGDLRLLPDPATRITVPGNGRWTDMKLVLCDLVHPDGRPWDCCPRNFLREALIDLDQELEAKLVASFEHEFQIRLDRPPVAPMSLRAWRSFEPFPSIVMAVLTQAGLRPEQFVPESADHQFEIPLAAASGLASADRAILFREVVREVARRQQIPLTFSALLDASEQGNGVHIHFSLIDRNGSPLFYDGSQPFGLSGVGASFGAGILEHARSLTAFTAPSPVSFARLRPGRRSAGFACLGHQNREAFLRLPPILTLGGEHAGYQVRLEYRAADAAANPYLALGMILRAGLDGVRRQLPCPKILTRDPCQLEQDELAGYTAAELPRNLGEALQALAQDKLASGWMSPRLYQAYLAIKHVEIRVADQESFDDSCRRYASIY